MAAPDPLEGPGAIVESEFAAVRVTVDHEGNGPRLRLEDLRTGRVGWLDPLMLETLAWLPPEELEGWLDPGRTRWHDQAPS